jgi:flagellar biosynthesis/type III secretory pathway chaperone
MDILEMLRMEKGLMLEMLESLRSEKEALIGDDIDRLVEASRSKEQLRQKIEEIEKSRISKYSNARLSVLLDSIDEESRLEAEELGKEMENMIFGIQEINNTNRLLIKQSLNYIRSVINAVSPARAATYKPTGQLQDGAASIGILNKSV